MRLKGALITLGLLLAGCGYQPHPVLPLPAAARPVALELRLGAPESRYSTQAVSHRWVASDIYQYEVTLRAYDGAGDPGPNAAVTVVLPQIGTPLSTAQFTNLRQGLRYEAEVVAKGNVGGTAADLVLNSQSPTQAVFDLTASQDVETSYTWSGGVTLDSALFSGSLRLEPQNLPVGTDELRVTLKNDDTGVTIYAANYAPTETMTLLNLHLGVPYRAWIEAISGGTVLSTTTSARYAFDPLGQDLEQDHVSRPSF